MPAEQISNIGVDDGNLMAIGIQFRMKGLNKADPKTLKGLRADGQALINEHSG